ncbi:unnamed protein product [Brachionus calyciflorus]|uniref:Uncharacterized protein n=1 Tax=Brachionus calyciflorus TaxID=104777 RepID=A0A814EZ68_9BILA|nr:unnamed protein product [Brachionus calyciflorus]
MIFIILNILYTGVFSHNILTDEHFLYKKLLKNYEPSVRPVNEHTRTLNIFFRLKLTQVLELSEKDQTLITNIWIEQQWFDEFLKWNSSEYSGITSLRMPTNRIWLPDTYIYNSASLDNSQGSITGPYAMVNNNGLVKFPVPMKLKSNCEVDIAYFPFDEQICYLKFASWLYDLATINFTTLSNSNSNKAKRNEFRIEEDSLDSKIDLSGYIDNSGWILMGVDLIRREKLNNSNGIHPELIYFIQIKRRYLYYVFNVILPCAMLSTLTCLTFWLPCVSGEKVTLGLTCFVAYSVFMLMVAEKVPTTSEKVPIISIYLTIVMSFTSMSVIMAVIVTNVNEKSKQKFTKDNRMPRLIRKIFIKYLAKYLGLQKQAKDLLRVILKRKDSDKQFSPSDFLSDLCLKHKFKESDLSDSEEIWLRNNIFDDSKYSDSELEQKNDATLPCTSKKSVNYTKERVKYKVKRDDLSLYFAYEYALMGLVLDRLFFWIYASFTLVSYLTTLFVFPFLVQSSKKSYSKEIP